ncbi:MAG: hypothetical protein ACYCUG_16430 [Acidimicrobiales bacterium]
MQRRADAGTAPLDAGLAILGLRAGEGVRWRAPGHRGWRSGTVSGRERDGSVAVRDDRGAARSLPVEGIEVSVTGPRGGRRWEPLTARAARSEQLRLFSPDATAGPPRRPLTGRGQSGRGQPAPGQSGSSAKSTGVVAPASQSRRRMA